MDILHAIGGAGLGVEILVLVVLKGAPLLAVIALLGWLIRGTGPALRSALWTCGAGALLLLPVFSLYLPGMGSGVVAYPESWLDAGPGGPPPAAWLLLLWAAGATALLARFALGLTRAAVQTRRARPCRDDRVLEAAATARRRLGVETRVRVLVSRSAASPFTWGWLRPVILLPDDASAWPDERLLAVLHHEMAHVTRRDFLVLVVLELARAVHWPNPLAWHLLARARGDQEMASDLAAIEGGLPAPVYARQLLELARGRLSAPPEPVLPVIRRCSLKARIHCIMDMDPRPPGRSARRWAVAAVAMLVTGLLFPLAAVNTWDCEDAGTAVVHASDAAPSAAAPDGSPLPAPSPPST